MWKFFRKFIKKIKGPWPETSTGARMNPRTSLICGGLALVVMGLAAARVTYSLYDIQIKNGDTYRQLAAKQQLLDTTIKATPRRDLRYLRHHAGLHQRGVDHLGRPGQQQNLIYHHRQG